jgi:RNA polymerase sigma factor (sigma-70 family)
MELHVSIDHSITDLLSGVKQADCAAIHAMFAKCYSRVVAIGHERLKRTPHRVFDQDDVANSAFREFLNRAAKGRFKKLENREDVWQVLTLLVGDKIADNLRHEGRKKRGGAEPKVELKDVAEAVAALDDPSLEAEINDTRRFLLKELPSDDHRRVVELLDEGWTHEEIAAKLGLSVRTVDRRIEDVRLALPRILGIDASNKNSSGQRPSHEANPHEHDA